MARALVVDDDQLLRFAVAGMLRKAGHEVQVAASGREGIDLGVRWRPDWLVTDWMLKDSLHGLHVASALQAVRPDMAAVLVTGFPLDDLEEAARDLGISGVLQKPFELEDLIATLTREEPVTRRHSPGHLVQRRRRSAVHAVRRAAGPRGAPAGLAPDRR